LNNVIKERYAPEHKKNITDTADDTLFRKSAKAGSVSALVTGAELGGLSALILLQSSCRYSSRFKSASVVLIGATRYKLADACGMQMQNLAEKAQNTGNRGTKD
jgi:hypothetical protein